MTWSKLNRQMNHIAINLKKLRERITYAEQVYGREPGSVKLLAVSKSHSIDAISEAIRAGQNAFGENYVQEALAKIAALKDEKIEWHYIGSIQSNKTKQIAENFSWVHSVDSFKVAEKLNNQRPPDLPPLNVCLQINIDQETTKAGVSLDKIFELAKKTVLLTNLKLRGLMVIPAPDKKPTAQRETFHQLKQMLQSLNTQGFNLNTLSMGMSEDYVIAIAEGATIVRIGTGIFGGRVNNK